MFGRRRRPDLYFFVGNGPNCTETRDQFFARYMDNLNQFDSATQAVSWSGGGAVTYVSRNDAYQLLLKMLAKLGELDGVDYGVPDGTIQSFRVVPRDPYTFRSSGYGYGGGY